MPRIIVVDDDPDVLEGSRRVLELEGFEVLTAANPADGMKQIEASAPDLVILDVVMDEADDGFIMARRLRAKGFERPILMLTSLGKVTGYEFAADEEMTPVDAFENKPIKPSVLVERVRELLAARKG